MESQLDLPNSCYCENYTPRRKKDGQRHYHCTSCSFAGTLDRMKRHMRKHLRSSRLVKDIIIQEQMIIISCTCSHFQGKMKANRLHFHCPYCMRAMIKCNMVEHMKVCKLKRDEPQNHETYLNEEDGHQNETEVNEEDGYQNETEVNEEDGYQNETENE